MYEMCVTRVFALAALLAGSAQAFSWDIVVGEEKRFDFYVNGTVTHTEHIPSANKIIAVTYEPQQHRLLFADCVDNDTMSIHSYDMSTHTARALVPSAARGYFVRLAFDPATQLLFWNDEIGIRTASLDPALANDTVEGEVLFSLRQVCRDIAVDSCGGYIYWITDFEIERARLDGSDREVLVNTIIDFRRGLAIEQKTQKLYWTETYSRDGEVQVTVANLDGSSRKRLHVMENAVFATSLDVTKDFVYWQQYKYTDDYKPEGVWGLSRSGSQHVALYATSEPGCRGCHRVAAHHSLGEQIQGGTRCEGLRRLLSNSPPEPADAPCRNYCLRGYCLDSAPGRPACSCDPGYSGERCEVHACHQYCSNGGVCSLDEAGEPVCQCTAGYVGERCDVSICKDYCLHQGNCSVGAESQPNCSCAAGYSGQRCEVEWCREHCLHGGACSVREGAPGCACAAGYSGERCELAACRDYCLHGTCSVGADGGLTCSCEEGFSGERCEVSVCHEYCLNGGVCSLSEAHAPACQCAARYAGARCELSADEDLSCEAVTEAGTVSACHQFCLHDGVCSLNEAGEPVCQCSAGHEGDRCEVAVDKDLSFQLVATVQKGQPKVTVTVGRGVESTCASAGL